MVFLTFLLIFSVPFFAVTVYVYLDEEEKSNRELGTTTVSPFKLKRKSKPLPVPELKPLTSEEERIMELVLQVGPEFGDDERDTELTVIPKILEYATLEYAAVEGEEDHYVFECPSCSTGGYGFAPDKFADMIEMARQHHYQSHVTIKLPEPRRSKKPAEPPVDRYSTVLSITDAELAAKILSSPNAHRLQLQLKNGSTSHLVECNRCGGGWSAKTSREADVQFYIHDCNGSNR